MSLREDLLKTRYLKDGETEAEFWIRVSEFVCTNEPTLQKLKPTILKGLTSGAIIFNSPLLMNAGRGQQLSSACFVYGVDDSIESIMRLQTVAASIFKLGAGIGVDYSQLRPEGAKVGSGGTSSGPCSFMTLVDHLAEVIKSGGRRRAAIMATLRVDHPDIKRFVACKRDDKTLQNTNISVMMTDEFMKKVKKKDPSVTPLWDLIVDNAWMRGDPGLVFIDTINRNTSGIKGMQYTAVNACSEFPLFPSESCLIGTLNIGKIYEDAVIAFEEKQFPRLESVDKVFEHLLVWWAKVMTRILDNVIDIAWYPFPEIEEAAKKYRRIGVSITGFGDYLIHNKIRYGSVKAIIKAKEVTQLINYASLEESRLLAKEKGAFPMFEQSTLDERLEGDPVFKLPRRNITTTTIAPAGSTSFLCNAECSGIEPVFAFAYKRMARLDKSGDSWYNILSPLLVNHLFKNYGIEVTDEMVEDVVKNNGMVSGLNWVPTKAREYLVTAHEITPEEHLNMLAAFQTGVGASVSKTINLPHSATKEDISNLYLAAWENNCKGITVFRDGCKKGQVLSTSTETTNSAPVAPKKVKLPYLLESRRVKIETPSGNMYVLVSFFDGRPIEVFANLGRSGQEVYAYTEGIGRVISLALKNGVDYSSIVKTLRGIRGNEVSLFNNEYVYSVPDAIAIAMDYAVKAFKNIDIDQDKQEKINSNLCPNCGEPLATDNGCFHCKSCLWSNCS